MDRVEGLTLAIAVLGAVLGVVNMWWMFWTARPRLRVTPVWMRKVPVSNGRDRILTSTLANGPERFPGGQIGVEVVNAGRVAVFIGEVGFCPDQRWIHRLLHATDEPERRALIDKDAFEQICLPYELMPGARVRIAAALGAHRLPAMREVTQAYARTEDARLFYGRNALLRKLANEGR